MKGLMLSLAVVLVTMTTTVYCLCPAAAQTAAPTLQYCGYINDTALGSPFSACALADAEMVSNHHDACVLDVCNTWEVDPKSSACSFLESFVVTHCLIWGYDPHPDWRNTTGCPLDCPVGMTYTFSGPVCHDTCEFPQWSETCSDPEVEGCRCPAGKLMLDDACVDPTQCGCMVGGQRKTIGSEWMSEDCSTKYTCELCPACASGLNEGVESAYSCPSGQQCIDGSCE